MALNPGQQEVGASEARFRVVIAGRRWGKTFLAIRELAKRCREPGKRAFYVAPTYRQAKQIVVTYHILHRVIANRCLCGIVNVHHVVRG